MKMNIYDFDGTIYKGDSGADFIKFVFFKKPLFMTKHLLGSLKYILKYKNGQIEFKEMKGKIFSFVKDMDNLEQCVEEFAEKKKNKVKEYYKLQKKDDDVIVSASLDFYLKPLCEKIGINNVICTKYDIKNGKILTENCKGQEKVKQFNMIYGEDAVVENAYGDTDSDIPMFGRAQNGFFIRGNNLVKYEK